MLLADLLIVLVIAAVFTLITASVTSSRRGNGGWITFFLLFLLLPWAGALWLPAYGPAVFGGFWVTPLIIAVVLFLLVAAFTPRRVPRRRSTDPQSDVDEKAAGTALSLFLLVLLGIAVAAIIVGYAVV